MPAKSYADNRDPKVADDRVVISQFSGLAPTQDPHDIDPNLSAYQINCYAMHPGELRCRPGMKLVVFAT
jgi:hypothetical protein